MRLRNFLLLGFLSALAIGCLRVKPSETQAPTPMVDAASPEGAGSAEVVHPGAAFQVKFETSKGDFVVDVHPEWAPQGAARFRELVEAKFYDDTRFFRVVPDFMVQWGINGNPQVQAEWRDATIPDDPVKQSNTPGMMTFATSGPNSRTAQVFINYANNSFLDGQGFSPFAQVSSGMDVVKAINSEYREQPDQGQIQLEGNAYLNRSFPKLDYIKTARIIEKPAEPAAEQAPATEAAPVTEKPATTAEPAAAPATEAPKETIEEIK